VSPLRFSGPLHPPGTKPVCGPSILLLPAVLDRSNRRCQPGYGYLTGDEEPYVPFSGQGIRRLARTTTPRAPTTRPPSLDDTSADVLSLPLRVTLELLSEFREADPDRLHERGPCFFGLLLDLRITQ
jgi:hypothetical protein